MGEPAGTDAGPEALVARVTGQLRARGERMTGPRRAVLTVLATTPGHLSAEVVQGLADEGRLPASTVYRTLEALCALGVVQHIHLGHGATAYHLTDEEHLHLECRACGCVVDLPTHLLAEVVERVRLEHGFRLEPAHTALSGMCERCAP